MKLNFYYLVILIFFLFTSRAYAYLDPGTGTIILQAILAFIAASIATLSFYWNKVKLFFSNFFKKEKKDKNEKNY